MLTIFLNKNVPGVDMANSSCICLVGTCSRSGGVWLLTDTVLDSTYHVPTWQISRNRGFSMFLSPKE